MDLRIRKNVILQGVTFEEDGDKTYVLYNGDVITIINSDDYYLEEVVEGLFQLKEVNF